MPRKQTTCYVRGYHTVVGRCMHKEPRNTAKAGNLSNTEKVVMLCYESLLGIEENN